MPKKKRHISVFRSMVIWGIGFLLILFGFANMTQGSVSGGGLLIIGFLVLIINKIVFKVRKTQLEIDAQERIRDIELKEKEKEEGYDKNSS